MQSFVSNWISPLIDFFYFLNANECELNQRTSQIRSMPFTGDSSDSESDDGGDGNGRSVSRAHGEDSVLNTEKSTAKSRGINPIIINQPPTPLLSRKMQQPCSLSQGANGVAGYYDNFATTYKPESPSLFPKTSSKICDDNLTSLVPLKPTFNNDNNTNQQQDVLAYSEIRTMTTLTNANSNGFIPSSQHSTKTSNRTTLSATPSKKPGTLYLDIVISLSVYFEETF